MRIIEIAVLENGAHRNQTGTFSKVPEGWAVIPEEMACDHFPFGDVTAEEIEGVMTVTAWNPGTMPEPTDPEPSDMDKLEAQVTYTAMMTDTLLEV